MTIIFSPFAESLKNANDPVELSSSSGEAKANTLAVHIPYANYSLVKEHPNRYKLISSDKLNPILQKVKLKTRPVENL